MPDARASEHATKSGASTTKPNARWNARAVRRVSTVRLTNDNLYGVGAVSVGAGAPSVIHWLSVASSAAVSI